MSMTRRLVLLSRPDNEVRALCEMCSSSREVRWVRPVMVRRRFAWMERMVRLGRLSRPYTHVRISMICMRSSEGENLP
jgi:hypothetical protein